MQNPAYEKETALQKQKALLVQKRDRLDQLFSFDNSCAGIHNKTVEIGLAARSGGVFNCFLIGMSCVILFMADRVAPAFRFCLVNSTLAPAIPIRYSFLSSVTHHCNTYMWVLSPMYFLQHSKRHTVRASRIYSCLNVTVCKKSIQEFFQISPI